MYFYILKNIICFSNGGILDSLFDVLQIETAVDWHPAYAETLILHHGID